MNEITECYFLWKFLLLPLFPLRTLLKLHHLVRCHLPEAPELNTHPLCLRPYDSLSNQIFSDTFSVSRYTMAFNFHGRFSSKLLTLASKDHHWQKPPLS